VNDEYALVPGNRGIALPCKLGCDFISRHNFGLTSRTTLAADLLMEPATFDGYRKLNKERREIRIVTLEGFETPPDKPTSRNVTCTVEQIPLDRANPFYALSYVWGDPSDTDLITLEGKRFRVRRNLWEFLQQLCGRFSKLRVWLDYICINQQDIEERNYQVSMMDQIYRSADAVYAWIGPMTVDSEDFFENVQIISGHQNKSVRTTQNYDSYEKLMSKYHDIAARDYWKRLWIIQEFVLARNLWIFCGPSVTNWKRFEYAITLRVEHLRFARNNSSSNAASLHSLLRARSVTRTDSLSNLVHRFKSSQCHDSRDRIFGLLSLADKSDVDAVKVDYGKPLLQVLLETCTLWSEALADNLSEVKDSMTKRTERLEWKSVSVFCNAILDMISSNDLDQLEQSQELRQDVATKCVFTSSTSPRRIYRVQALAAVRWDGSLTTEMAVEADHPGLGYLSQLKETPSSSSWLFAFTNIQIAESDIFITIGDATLLLIREESRKSSTRSPASQYQDYTVVASGVLFEPLQLSCCTRMLRLPRPGQILRHNLPDSEYKILTHRTHANYDRELQGRLKIEFSTGALCTLLMTHQMATAQSARRSRDHDYEHDAFATKQAAFTTNQAAFTTNQAAFTTNQAAFATNQDTLTWSPWDFGLENHILQPCLTCKLNSHMKWSATAGLHARCECEWITHSSSLG
jgi:hypothetical protein